MNEGQTKLIEMLRAKMLDDGGISVRQAATRINLSHGALNNILNGDRDIGAEAAIRIAQYLGLPPANVLNMLGLTEFLDLIKAISPTTPTQTISPIIYDLAREFHDLTPNQIKSIINIARTFKETNELYLTTEKK